MMWGELSFGFLGSKSADDVLLALREHSHEEKTVLSLSRHRHDTICKYHPLEFRAVLQRNEGEELPTVLLNNIGMPPRRILNLRQEDTLNFAGFKPLEGSCCRTGNRNEPSPRLHVAREIRVQHTHLANPAMYQKIAKFSTLSTGVKLNHKCKFYSIFSLFITV